MKFALVLTLLFLQACGSRTSVEQDRKCINLDCVPAGNVKAQNDSEKNSEEKKPEVIASDYKFSDFTKPGKYKAANFKLEEKDGSKVPVINTDPSKQIEFTLSYNKREVHFGNIHFPVNDAGEILSIGKELKSDEALPVIIFFGDKKTGEESVTSAEYQALIDHWVSHGFVVMRRTYPYNVENSYTDQISQISGLVNWIQDLESSVELFKKLKGLFNPKGIYLVGAGVGAKNLVLSGNKLVVRAALTFNLKNLVTEQSDDLDNVLKTDLGFPMAIWGVSSKESSKPYYKEIYSKIPGDVHYLSFDRFSEACLKNDSDENKACSTEERANWSNSFLPMSTLFLMHFEGKNVGDLLKVKGPTQLKNNLDVDEDPVIKGKSFDPITIKN